MTQKIRNPAMKASVSGSLAVALPGVAGARGGRDLDTGAVWTAWDPTLAVSGPPGAAGRDLFSRRGYGLVGPAAWTTKARHKW